MQDIAKEPIWPDIPIGKEPVYLLESDNLPPKSDNLPEKHQHIDKSVSMYTSSQALINSDYILSKSDEHELLSSAAAATDQTISSKESSNVKLLSDLSKKEISMSSVIEVFVNTSDKSTRSHDVVETSVSSELQSNELDTSESISAKDPCSSRTQFEDVIDNKPSCSDTTNQPVEDMTVFEDVRPEFSALTISNSEDQVPILAHNNNLYSSHLQSASTGKRLFTSTHVSLFTS